MSVTVIEEPHLIPTLDILFAEQCRLPPSSTASSEPPSPTPLSDSTLSQSDPTSQLASSTSTYTTASASASASPSASPSASASTSSLSAPLRSVKFAPLPELGPRKRRSNAPLGMAARGALARRRRPSGGGMSGGVVIVAVAGTAPTDIPPDVPPENIRYVTPAEFEAHRMQQEAMAARYAQHQGLAAAMAARQLEAEQEAELEREEREREMARAALEEARATGGKVKQGKKGFWKRVVQHRESESSLRKDEQGPEGNVLQGKVKRESSLRRTKSDIQKAATPPLSQTPPPPLPPLRPILATAKSDTSTNSSTPVNTDTNSECHQPPTDIILPALGLGGEDIADDGSALVPTPPAAEADNVITTEDSDSPPPPEDPTPTPTPETPPNVDDTKADDCS